MNNANNISIARTNKILLSLMIFASLPLHLIINSDILKVIIGGTGMLFVMINKRGLRKQFLPLTIITMLYVFYSSFGGVAGFDTWINISYTAVFLFFMNRNEILYSFNKLKTILAIIFAAGIVFYILAVLNIISPIGVLEHPFRPGSMYNIYPMFLVETKQYLSPIYALGLFRFGSIFDEPGAVGTLSALILICNPPNVKYTKYDYILLIAGIISFSLAFYVIIAINYILNFKIGKQTIIIACLALALYAAFPKVVNNIILDRLEYSDGKFAGDNRVASDFEDAYNKFQKSEYTLFGMGNGAHQKYPGSATYLSVIYNQGYFGFIIYLLIFLLFTRHFKGKRKWIFFFIFMLNIYQRPYNISLLYLLLLYSGLYLYSQNNKLNNDFSNNTIIQ